MRRAWLIGAGVLALAFAAIWICARLEVAPAWTEALVWSPAPAAFLTAWIAPRRRVLLGGSMCLPATAMAAVVNLAGPTDFPGPRGEATLMGVTLGWTFLLCFGVAGLAVLVSKK